MKNQKTHATKWAIAAFVLVLFIFGAIGAFRYYDRNLKIVAQEYLNPDITEIVNEKNKHGLMDSHTENKLVGFRFDDVSSVGSDFVVRVENDGKAGLLSLVSFELILPIEYDDIHSFDDHTGLCCAVKNDSLFFFDESGRIKPYAFALNYTDPEQFYGFDEYGLSIVPITNNNKTFLALIDTNGKPITKEPYNNIENHPYFTDESGNYLGYYTIETIDGLFGVIDTNGVYIVKPEYIFVDLIEQFGIVVATDSSQFLLSFDGKPKVLHVYDEVGEVFEDPYFAVWINGNQGIVDIYGNIIIRPRWDEVNVINAEAGIFCAAKDDYKVILDKNDNFIDTPDNNN